MISMTFDNAFKLFEEYSSNTVAGTNNNFILKGSFDNKTSAIYYKVQNTENQFTDFAFQTVLTAHTETEQNVRQIALAAVGGSFPLLRATAVLTAIRICRKNLYL